MNAREAAKYNRDRAAHVKAVALQVEAALMDSSMTWAGPAAIAFAEFITKPSDATFTKLAILSLGYMSNK